MSHLPLQLIILMETDPEFKAAVKMSVETGRLIMPHVHGAGLDMRFYRELRSDLAAYLGIEAAVPSKRRTT